MAKLKYYRYASQNGEGKFPKKGFVRYEDAPEGYDKLAAYNTLIPDGDVKRFKLVDMNPPIRAIQKYRVLAGIQQKDFAKLMGIPLRTLQGWETHGMAGAALASAVMIADYFGIKDVRDLLDNEDDFKE